MTQVKSIKRRTYNFFILKKRMKQWTGHVNRQSENEFRPLLMKLTNAVKNYNSQKALVSFPNIWAILWVFIQQRKFKNIRVSFWEKGLSEAQSWLLHAGSSGQQEKPFGYADYAFLGPMRLLPAGFLRKPMWTYVIWKNQVRHSPLPKISPLTASTFWLERLWHDKSQKILKSIL